VTIREYVEKRKKLIGRVQLLWGVVMVAGAVGLARLPEIFRVVVFVLWMVVMTAIPPMMRLLCRCPRCGGVLLRPIFGKVTSTPDICPHCGVSVDEPMRPGP
jgi:hypothetical protein